MLENVKKFCHLLYRFPHIICVLPGYNDGLWSWVKKSHIWVRATNKEFRGSSSEQREIDWGRPSKTNMFLYSFGFFLPSPGHHWHNCLMKPAPWIKDRLVSSRPFQSLGGIASVGLTECKLSSVFKLFSRPVVEESSQTKSVLRF